MNQNPKWADGIVLNSAGYQGYYYFKENKRFDLIAKYMKALTALGATAQEFDAGESIMEELDEFAAEDFAAQLEAMAEGGEEGVN